MPLYFFNFRSQAINGESEGGPDEVGAELPNIAAAKREAEIGARDILAEKLRFGEVLEHETIEITDEEGQILLKVAFKDVYSVRPSVEADANGPAETK